MNNGGASSHKKILLWLGSAIAASVISIIVGQVFELGPFRPAPDIQITQFSLTNEKGLEHLPLYAPFRALAEEPTRAEVVLFNAGGRTAVECDVELETLDRGVRVQTRSLQRFSIPPGESVTVALQVTFPQPSNQWRASTGYYPAQVFGIFITAYGYTYPRKGEMFSPKGRVEAVAYRDIAVFATPEASRR